MASSIVVSRIDYCYSLLYGASCKVLDKLQRVQNHIARVVCNVGRRDHHTIDLLRSLHWLPVRRRKTFKVATLTFKARKLGQPRYLMPLVQSSEVGRDLRSFTRAL